MSFKGRNYKFITGDCTLLELVEQHILGSGRRIFIIGDQQHVQGLLTVHRIKGVPRENWGTTTVSAVMIPEASMFKISPDFGLWEALLLMDRDGVNQLPVMTNSHLEGLLSREDVISYLRTAQELGV